MRKHRLGEGGDYRFLVLDVLDDSARGGLTVHCASGFRALVMCIVLSAFYVASADVVSATRRQPVKTSNANAKLTLRISLDKVKYSAHDGILLEVSLIMRGKGGWR